MNSTTFSGYFVAVNTTRTSYIYNSADRGAIIYIDSSTFKHSRFCKGMIAYRKPAYDPLARGLLNLTNLFMTTPSGLEIGSSITLKDSTFDNLNAFTNLSALAIYEGKEVKVTMVEDTVDSFEVPAFIHKGIVLNIQDFNGKVEITGCTFKRNTHFIPSIYYSTHSNSDTFSTE